MTRRDKMKMFQKLMLIALVALGYNTAITAMNPAVQAGEDALRNMVEQKAAADAADWAASAADLTNLTRGQALAALIQAGEEGATGLDDLAAYFKSSGKDDVIKAINEYQQGNPSLFRPASPEPAPGMMQRFTTGFNKYIVNPTMSAASRFGSTLKPYTYDVAASVGRGFRNIGEGIYSGIGNVYGAIGTESGAMGLIKDAISNNPGLRAMWSNLDSDTKNAVYATVGAILASATAYGTYRYFKKSDSGIGAGSSQLSNSNTLDEIDQKLNLVQSYFDEESISKPTIIQNLKNAIVTLNEISNLTNQSYSGNISSIISNINQILRNTKLRTANDMNKAIKNANFTSSLAELRNNIFTP